MAGFAGQKPLKDISVVIEGLRYPEGAFWSARNGCLYFVEWAGDTIWRLQDGRAKVLFRTQPGDGPCGLSEDAEGCLWVCLYSSRRLVRFNLLGKPLQIIEGWRGQPFKGPNDLIMDAQGGLYFTDSGDFEADWETGRPAGALYYLNSSSQLMRVDDGLCYPNGLAISPDGRWLIVGEHRRNRLLRYAIRPSGVLSERMIFHTLDNQCLLPNELYHELGPDGMCCDREGRYSVAHYGGGKIVAVGPDGSQLGQIRLPAGRKPTNVAVTPDGLALYVTEAETGCLYQIVLAV